MKIIYQNILPPRGFAAIMLFGRIWARKECKPLSDATINHEAIHGAQAQDCGGWIPFYVRYLCQWARVGFKYDHIPFEMEAYRNEGNLKYLENRAPFAWKV
jgi:hypothetical protein